MKDIYEEYLTYEEREKIKSEGWSEISKTEDNKVKAMLYVNKIIYSHYWRARENLENGNKYKTNLKKIRGNKYYPGYSLEFDHYVLHWLWSWKETLDSEIMKEIKNIFHYEPEECKYMKNRHTYYNFSV